MANHVHRTQRSALGPVLPQTRAGWWCLGLAAVPLLFLGLVMVVFPILGMLLGIEEIGLGPLDAPATPLALVLLLLAAGVTGVLAWRRGERGALPTLVMWLALAAGGALAIFVGGYALAG
jgi:hypothetical protein